MYTPISQNIFDAVYHKVLGGILNSRYSTDTIAVDYDNATKVAGAVAQEVDTKINLALPTSLQVEIVSSVAGNALSARLNTSTVGQTATTYAGLGDAIVAILTQSAAFYLANVTSIAPTGSGGHSYIASYANVTAGLQLVSAAFLTSLNNGDKVYVTCFRDSFTWYTGRVDVADGITIVNPTVNVGLSGRFIRDGVPCPTWASQGTWYINATTGNDEDFGVSSGTALKTDAERQRRWGAGFTPSSAITVNYLTDLPITDIVSFDVTLNGYPLTIAGATTDIKNSTFASVTVYNRGAQTPDSITSAVAFDGTELNANAYIFDNTGTNTAAIAWPLKFTGGSLRITRPGKAVFQPVLNFSDNPFTNGDAYILRKVPQVYAGQWVFNSKGSGNGANVYVQIRDIAINGGAVGGAQSSGSINAETARVCLGRCAIANMWLAGEQALGLTNCLFSAASYLHENVRVIGGGASDSSVITIAQAGQASFDFDFRMQNANLIVSENAQVSIGTLNAFDNAATNTILLRASAMTISKAGGDAGADLIWGTANTGYAIALNSGAGLAYTTKPTINGGLGAGRESIVGGTGKQWGAIPFADSGATASQAYIVALA